MTSIDTIVTIPTYCEAENIEALIRALIGLSPRIGVVVADDESPDGTADIVRRLAEQDERVHLLLRRSQHGRGHAGRDAFVKALQLGAQRVVEMDADFSHHPDHVPALLAALDQADVVLGSRQVPGGQDVGRPWSRVMLTRASNLFVRIMLGVPVKDANSGYRAFRREALQAVDVAHAFSSGPAIVHELLYKASLRGLRITEVPIVFRERELGTSTLTFRKLLRSYVSVFRLRWLALTGRLLPPTD